MGIEAKTLMSDRAVELEEKVIEKLRLIFDPEIPVNIYELGLIYEIQILPVNNVQIVMTLTSPACPAAQTIPVEVDQKVRTIEGVNDVHVSVTWTPTWDKSMMSEAAQLELGMM
jgi:FeS assembly SUF system protein